MINLIRLASFVMLTTLAAAARAETMPQNHFDNDPAMSQCQSFNECMIVWGGCADAAINKRYLAQFKPSEACAASAPHDARAIPTCTDGQCVVVIPEKGGDQ